MSQHRVIHDTFTVERTVSATPARVFEALSKPEIKAKWFAGPTGWKEEERVMDFRVGGRERVKGVHQGGITSLFDCLYLDVVPGERIVYTYEMTVNGRKISTSLATFELVAEGTGKTRIVLTEQGAYFHDPELAKYTTKTAAESRLEGTKGLMEQLAAVFAS
jgi:uncharacterized protein YndB with AHSA1/START domain